MLRIIFFAVLVLSLTLQTGCQSAGRSLSINRAADDYAAGRYARAYDSASKIAVKGDRETVDRAHYIAGASAFQLGDLISAEQHLIKAGKARDSSISGKANATLGLVRMRDGRPKEAAAAFGLAATQLKGQDASNAAYQAARAYETAGEPRTANSWFAMATESGANSGLRLFALQIGVFRNRTNAKRAADSFSEIAGEAGLGDVQVIATRNDRNKPQYVVQFGRFLSRKDAADVREQLAKPNLIVAALADPFD